MNKQQSEREEFILKTNTCEHCGGVYSPYETCEERTCCEWRREWRIAARDSAWEATNDSK